jgi:replicative DNA helicase
MSFILAARPSLGKSALAMNIASVVSVDVPVLFFSVEMSKEELIDRLLASTSGVGLSKLRQGDLIEDEAGRLFDASRHLAKLNLSIDDTATSMSSIARKTRRFASRTPPGLVVIDYLQLLAEDKGRESRNVEVGNISRSIKLMAREHHVPVLTLSQLNRPDTRYQSGDGASEPRPTLASLRDSGSIEQDADVVCMIHRKNLADVENTELLVLKARNGSPGTVKLAFTPHTLTFAERMN